MSNKCIKCFTDITSQWYEDGTLCNACYKKQYYIKNKAVINKRNKQNYRQNKKHIDDRVCLNCNKEFSPTRIDNKYCRRYCGDKHTRSLRKSEVNDYFRNKYHNDIMRKMSACLRSRIRSAINNNQKAGSAVTDLGCSVNELKQHIESKWQNGMTWNNWSLKGWHIDHIKPLSKFDLTNEEEFKKACHYTNLQPLWAEDNLKKGNKESW